MCRTCGHGEPSPKAARDRQPPPPRHPAVCGSVVPPGLPPPLRELRGRAEGRGEEGRGGWAAPTRQHAALQPMTLGGSAGGVLCPPAEHVGRSLQAQQV